jgi:hypothetical protein
MERSFSEEIKNRTVDADDPLWQSLRDNLFLAAMSYGPDLKNTYDSFVKPSRINFSGRDWDIFKGILSIAKSVAEEVFERVVSFAVATHEVKVTRDHDNSPDMIILKYLSEIVTKDKEWYELGELNDGLTEMARTQGLDLQGQMYKDRLGKLSLYKIDPEVIARKLGNHMRG